MEPKTIVRVVDDLAKQARDEESVYRTAVVDADGLSLTAYSVISAESCRARAEELEGIAMLYRNGHMPLWHRFAPLARKWRSTFGHRHGDMEIVEICNSYNDAALRAYERALRLPLPGTLRTALSNQLATIRDGYRGLLRMRQHIWLRDEFSKALALQANP